MRENDKIEYTKYVSWFQRTFNRSPSNVECAGRFRCSVRTIQRWKSELKKMCAITVENVFSSLGRRRIQVVSAIRVNFAVTNALVMGSCPWRALQRQKLRDWKGSILSLFSLPIRHDITSSHIQQTGYVEKRGFGKKARESLSQAQPAAEIGMGDAALHDHMAAKFAWYVKPAPG